MNLEQAKRISAPYEQNKENKVIVVTSDHGIFLGDKEDNSAMIMSVCKHAVRNKLEYFFIKGEEPTIEEIQAAIDEDTRQYYNSKTEGKNIAQEKLDEKAFKELIKSGKNFANAKNWTKARAEFAQALKLQPDNSEAKELHDEAYNNLVDLSKELDEQSRVEQAKRDELIRKLGLNGDATDEQIEEAIAKRDAKNDILKSEELKARAEAVGLDENATEDDIKAAEKKAKKKKK